MPFAANSINGKAISTFINRNQSEIIMLLMIGWCIWMIWTYRQQLQDYFENMQ